MNNIPFPQANSLQKIFDLVCLFGTRTDSELKSILCLSTNRQIAYYFNACVFLNFFHRVENKYCLTDLGEVVHREQKEFKKERFILAILRHNLIKSIIFTDSDLHVLLENHFQEFSKLAPATQQRRINTIHSWKKWIYKNI